MSTIGYEKLKWIMKTLFRSAEGPGLPSSVQMLHADGAREAILEGLPECDRWGTVTRGAGNIGRPNPFLGRPRVPEPASDEAADENEGDGVDAGGPSSAPPMCVTPPSVGRKRGPPSSEDRGPHERPMQ